MKDTKSRVKRTPFRSVFDLGYDLHLRLGEIATKSGCISRSDVVRRAVRVYDFLVNEAAGGSEFQVIDKSGKVKSVIFFADLPIGPKTADDIPDDVDIPGSSNDGIE